MSYWSDMFIKSSKSSKSIQPNSTQPNSTQPNQIIISKEPPVPYDKGSKNFTLFEGITPSQYQEVSAFIEQHNCMSTGNTTLLPTTELERYLNMENISVLMRGNNQNKLMGTILSLVLPIKIEKKIITHGCTTFLNVHPAIRGFGMCMALIRGLAGFGYKKKVYCDYHMVAFKLGDNSVKLNSWYRPINLNRCKDLGFLYHGCNDSRSSIKNRLKYTNDLRGSMNFVKVGNDEDQYKYYLETVKNKKFVFYPDIDLWKKWITSFPTYIIYNNSAKVGIVSLNTTYCVIESTGGTGKVCFPIICNGDMEYVLPVLNHIARIEKYDVVYFHQHGDVTQSALESINAIKTDTTLWFSLYNNSIDLDSSDIYAPLL